MECPSGSGLKSLVNLHPSIRDYLLNTNVQLGASYVTGKKSTERYNEGYASAAKYIKASRDEIGASRP